MGFLPRWGVVGFADAFWRSSCRLAPTIFTKKARQSVAHLTMPVRFGFVGACYAPIGDEGKSRPYNDCVWFVGARLAHRYTAHLFWEYETHEINEINER
jgi:hypothetical protein